MIAERTLPPTRRRFVAKPDGRHWGVYDTARGSYPKGLESFGAIAQEHPTEAAAQAEADRVEALR